MATLKKKLHRFKSKITAEVRSLSRRQRRLLLLDVLLIGLVAAFYILFFVPRDGAAMFQMAAQRSRRITSCVQDMSLKTELEISSKDIAFSQKKKSAAEKCPVHIRVKMKQGEGGAKISRTTKVTLNGKTSSFKTMSYYDAKQKVLYSRKSSGWSRKENQANQVSDVQSLLKLNESVLRNSAFAKTDRGYEVRIPAEQVGVSPIVPLLKDDENTEIAGGEFCFVFGKFSHRLTQIEGDNVTIRRNGKKTETCGLEGSGKNPQKRGSTGEGCKEREILSAVPDGTEERRARLLRGGRRSSRRKVYHRKADRRRNHYLPPPFRCQGAL